MPKALYLHIPFCEHICHYCDFNKVYLKNQPVEQYISALEVEMKQAAKVYPDEKLQTIYIGGGTPTALTTEQLEKLLSSINNIFETNSDSLEFTVEVNPGSADERKLEKMASLGVNRLSVGVQSFDNQVLAEIGRTHRKREVFQTIEVARKVGFTNISMDLMFGLPKQSIDIFKETLYQTAELGIEHVSAYSLKVEAKTVFYNLQRKGKLHLPSEEDEALMYQILLDFMERSGFVQYEISNFAKPGFKSKHNLTYWENEEYFGIGAGAHGYVNGIRYVNAGPLPKYLTLMKEKNNPSIERHYVTKKEQIEEHMFMGLRKTDGVSKDDFYKRFGITIEELFREQLVQLKQKGLIHDDGNFIYLTRKGLFFGNDVFEQFLAI